MQRLLIFVGLVVAGIAVAVFLNRQGGASQTTEAPDSSSPRTRAEGTADAVPWPFDGGVVLDRDAGVAEDLAAPSFDLGDLDYAALRKQTPDSLYWLMAAPTQDAEVLEARRRARDERNEQYGKVVSNTATVEEIRDYYAYRRKLSEDYIEVLQLILDEHGTELSERDVGLLELALSMHSSLLSELPKKEDDALQRKAEYDRVKRAWQEQQASEAEGADTQNTPELP